MATIPGVRAGLGFRPILEFEGVYDIWPRGKRPEAIRHAAEVFKRRFKAQGEVLAVRSVRGTRLSPTAVKATNSIAVKSDGRNARDPLRQKR